MNKFEQLAKKLGNDNLLKSDDNLINNNFRQAISYYLSSNGYALVDIAKWQGTNKAVVVKQIKAFKDSLNKKDKLSVELWNKLNS